MYCEKCSEFFAPDEALQKLISTGGVPCLCEKCATAAWNASVANDALPALTMPGRTYKGDGSQLYRVNWFRPDGTERAFMALPPLPVKMVLSPLRPKRMHQLHVQIMTTDTQHSSGRRLSEPALILYSNATQFNKRDTSKLWIRKSIDCYDSFTGVARIEFDSSKIADFVKSDKRIDVALNDGDSVRMLYR